MGVNGHTLAPERLHRRGRRIRDRNEYLFRIDAHCPSILSTVMDRKHIWSGKIGAGQIIGDVPVFETFYGGGLGVDSRL